MRTLAAVAAAAAVSLATPAAQALPPIPGWPLGTTCHYSRLILDPDAKSYVFSIEGGPLLPVTDTGEQVSDVQVTCTLTITPVGYDPVTMGGTSTNIAGVAYLPRQTQVVPTQGGYSIMLCSDLTWTDSAGVARQGGSCAPL